MKKTVSWLIVFLVVSAMMVSAQPEEASETSCSGFWGYLKCFFSSGSSGKGGALVGGASQLPVHGWQHDSANNRYICANPSGCYDTEGNLQEIDYTITSASFEPTNVLMPPGGQTYLYTRRIDANGLPIVVGENGQYYFTRIGSEGLEVTDGILTAAELDTLPLTPEEGYPQKGAIVGIAEFTLPNPPVTISPPTQSGQTSNVGTSLTTGTPTPHIAFKFTDTQEERSYFLAEEAGTIGGVSYTRKYFDQEHDRVIFFNAAGEPIGYSEGLEFKLYTGGTVGREGLALRNALNIKFPPPASAPASTGTAPPPHVIRQSDGDYETEKGYYFFYDEDPNRQYRYDSEYTPSDSSDRSPRVVSIQEAARQELGDDLYTTYAEGNLIDWKKSTPYDYVLKSGGTMAVDPTNTNDPLKKVNIVKLELKDKDQPDKDKSGTYIIKNGQQVAFQSLKQQEEGTITVSGNPFFVGKDKDTLDNLASGKVVKYYEGADAKNQLGVIAVQGDSRTITNFKEETQTVYNTQTDTTEQREGDYYPKGERSCTDVSGCFRPSGGEIRDANGNLISLVNYDYESSGGAGQELGIGGNIPGLKRKERFDPVSGTFDGIEMPDGTVIIAQKNDKGEYSGGNAILAPDGRIITTRVEGNRVIATYDSRIAQLEQQLQALGTTVGDATTAYDLAVTEENRVEQAFGRGEATQQQLDAATAALKSAEERKKEADKKLTQTRQDLTEAQDQQREIVDKQTPAVLDVHSTTRDWEGRLQRGVEAVYAITSQVKSYPALTRLFGLPRTDRPILSLFGLEDADKTFAPMLGSNWFPSAICEAHYDIEPEGMAVIKTVSGTYQAVANIQMERSETTSPILCARNPDPEAEEEFICDPGQVCVDNSFCYQDEDGDKEPDEDTPLGGYFYKITWGVSAPRDEAFTPFINEDGVAVSFNVWIDTTPNDGIDAGAIHMYINTTTGDRNGPIRLRNGQSDKDTIIHYSPNLFQEACIGWKQAPSTSDTFVGSSTIGDVCFTVDVSSIGEANFGNAGRNAPASTVQGGQVTRNAGW